MTSAAGLLIAQISDLHVMQPGRYAFGDIDTAANLARCLARITALRPQPLAVIASGDLVDEGEPAEYQRLRALLAPLPMPVYLMPGNHDRRAALCQAFPEHHYLNPGNGALKYALKVGGLHLFMLDTVVDGEPHGALESAQIDWLDAGLSAASPEPVMIFLHHPPVATGMALMDNIGLEPRSAGALEAVVRRHRHIARISCGHVHRPIEMHWAGTPVSVCPSSAFQSALAFDGSDFRAARDEPPGYQLHYWDGRVLATHTVSVYG